MARPNPDRPHTLAGLVEKRAELAGMLKFDRAEIRKVTAISTTWTRRSVCSIRTRT